MKSLFGTEKRADPWENPAIPLSSSALLNMLGGSPTESGISVTEESSVNMSSVFRGYSLLAGLLASTPLSAYRYSDKASIDCVAISRPNSLGQTPYEVREVQALHAIAWGNSYSQKVRNALGTIVELRPIHPSRARIALERDTKTGALGKVFYIQDMQGTETRFLPYDILHIPGLSFDGISGISPVAAMRQAIGTGQAADKLAARLFGNGAMLSGVLQVEKKISQEQADALKNRWREKIAGIDNAHDITVLDSGTKFTPISMPPEDAQFLQTRQWQVQEIARFLGLPPHLLSDVSGSTSWGSGIAEQNRGLVTFTMQFWYSRFEQRYTWEVVEPSTQFAEFDLSNLLRGNLIERYKAYALGIQWGFLTRNEPRFAENLEPIDGLDEPLQPVAMPATSVGGEEDAPGAGTGDDNSPDNSPGMD